MILVAVAGRRKSALGLRKSTMDAVCWYAVRCTETQSCADFPHIPHAAGRKQAEHVCEQTFGADASQQSLVCCGCGEQQCRWRAGHVQASCSQSRAPGGDAVCNWIPTGRHEMQTKSPVLDHNGSNIMLSSWLCERSHLGCQPRAPPRPLCTSLSSTSAGRAAVERRRGGRHTVVVSPLARRLDMANVLCSPVDLWLRAVCDGYPAVPTATMGGVT